MIEFKYDDERVVNGWQSSHGKYCVTNYGRLFYWYAGCWQSAT